MPGRDKTGPWGNGSFGRGMGGCIREHSTPVSMGYGFGRRGGRGRGGWFRFGASADLQSRKSFLERELDQINNILDGSAENHGEDTKAE